jgi:hypothetical protein
VERPFMPASPTYGLFTVSHPSLSPHRTTLGVHGSLPAHTPHMPRRDV